MAERAIVLQVLRNDHAEQWPRAELESEVSDMEPLTISDALASLAAESVVILDGDRVWASQCAKYLNTLGLIAI